SFNKYPWAIISTTSSLEKCCIIWQRISSNIQYVKRYKKEKKSDIDRMGKKMHPYIFFRFFVTFRIGCTRAAAPDFLSHLHA
ncbi:hypothetical protein ACJX0J_010927, partial [Zea mays]